MRCGKRKRRNTDVHRVSTVVLALHSNAFAAVLGSQVLILNTPPRPF